MRSENFFCLEKDNKLREEVEIAFFKGPFRDSISRGIPHLYDGNGDLYKQAYFQ